jgi:hypothetical protein
MDNNLNIDLEIKQIIIDSYNNKLNMMEKIF